MTERVRTNNVPLTTLEQLRADNERLRNQLAESHDELIRYVDVLASLFVIFEPAVMCLALCAVSWHQSTVNAKTRRQSCEH